MTLRPERLRACARSALGGRACARPMRAHARAHRARAPAHLCTRTRACLVPAHALTDARARELAHSLACARPCARVHARPQFSNMVLEQTYERHIVAERFADEPLGLYVVRGENLVLMGEIDEAREKPPELREVSLDEIRAAMLAQKELGALAGKTAREATSIVED